MKGQKSLAMIVSMSIMSVVILVLIGFIQESATSFEESEVMDTRVEEVRSTCSQTCERLQNLDGEAAVEEALSYCSKRFDLGDTTGEVLGQGYNSYCSDGARCFNVDSCNFKGQALNADHCRELMCEKFKDSSNPGERVQSQFEEGRAEGNFGAGSCDLGSVEDSAGYEVSNWWTENFDVEESEVESICGEG